MRVVGEKRLSAVVVENEGRGAAPRTKEKTGGGDE